MAAVWFLKVLSLAGFHCDGHYFESDRFYVFENNMGRDNARPVLFLFFFIIERLEFAFLLFQSPGGHPE